MEEGINPQRLFVRSRENIEKNQEKELDNGPKRSLLSPGTKISLKDYRGEIVDCKVPEGRKLELFYNRKKEDKEPSSLAVERSRESKELNEEDQKIRYTLVRIYGQNEEGEYTNVLTELRFERKNSEVIIKPGDSVWCSFEDFEKQLIPEEEQENGESGEEIMGSRAEEPGNNNKLADRFQKRGERWAKKGTYHPPYKDGNNDY